MDIRSFFGAGTSSSVAVSSTHTEKGSNCSDSDIAEPPSKKACRELIQPSTTKRKYSKNWENEFSWLVYDEDINGAKTDHSREHHSAHRRFLGHKTIPELEESYREKTAHERSSLHTQASQALLVISKQGSVVQLLQRVRHARKREEHSCNEIFCTLHSLSYLAPYCSLYQFHSIS